MGSISFIFGSVPACSVSGFIADLEETSILVGTLPTASSVAVFVVVAVVNEVKVLVIIGNVNSPRIVVAIDGEHGRGGY